MILYIRLCIVLIELVEMSTSNSRPATIGRNFGQKLTSNSEFSKLLKQEDEDQCGFNKIPTLSVATNEQEFITLQPVSTSESGYRPPTPAPYSPSKQLSFLSSFYGPIGPGKIKHILAKVKRIPGASMETLTFVNIMDQEYYGINIVDDQSFIKVVFQPNLNPRFKDQVVKMFKSGKFF